MTAATTDILGLEAEHGAGVYVPRGIALVRGEGAYLFDEEDRRYLDMTSAYGVACLGHAHPVLVEALREQTGRLWNASGSFGNDQRARYLAELTEVLPTGMDRVFLCNSGTEASEAALKIARLSTGRHGIVACMRGFHGRTMGALTATWDKKYREPFAPLVPDVHHVPYDNLEKLDAAVNEDTAAVILEIVQGEGGVRAGSAEFLIGAQRLCRERGAMLVVDEVQTGFGRTGRTFAVEHHGLEPDLMGLAKGIAGGFPMGAVAIGPRVNAIPPGAHGSTFGGNPLACAAARAVLRVLAEDDLVANAEAVGRHLREGLAAIDSPRVREVRGLGLLVGVELKEKVGPYVRALSERGVLALNAGPTVLRFLPPLTLTREQADTAIAAVRGVLEAGA